MSKSSAGLTARAIQTLALIFINPMNVSPLRTEVGGFLMLSHQMQVKFNIEGKRIELHPLWVPSVP